jgi:hypothetical protein
MTSEKDRNTSYEKDFVIGELLKSSKEFNAFYKAERAKITKPIKWIECKSLEEESPARYSHKRGEIILRRIPAKIEDAMIVAHELQHAVIKSTGFPSTIRVEDKREDLSTPLNSMVHDPLVYETLQLYGFDLLADFTKWTSTSPSTPPPNDLDKKVYIFNYVKRIIHWEIIRTEGDSSSEFQLKFELHHPELANEGQELLALVKSIGYGTPEKMRKLIREIITKYRLNDYILEAD